MDADVPPARPRVAILGAGPIGLDAALGAAEAGFSFRVYEQAPTVAGHVRDWSHVRLFSPWDLDVSPRMRRALAGAGWTVPTGNACPTGAEFAREVLERVGGLPEIAPNLVLGTRVVAVGREGLLKHHEIATAARAARPFRLLLVDARGDEQVAHADVVLDCTGVWSRPNALGDGGIPAPGERALAHRIDHRIPDFAHEAEAWTGRRVLVVGGGHSAQTAIVALGALTAANPGTEVVWAVRGDGPLRSVPDGSDPLPERAAVEREAARIAEGRAPGFEVLRRAAVERLAADGERLAVTLRVDGEPRTVVADRVLALVGGVGDHDLYRQLQIHECYATSGPMKLSAALLGADSGADCLAAPSPGVETLRNPEPGFFILGVKSYGRNPTFLLRTGYEQVEQVMSLLAPHVEVPA